MRERPILFSGPMVRAILDGRKTQTRRVAKELMERKVGNRVLPDVADAVHPDGSGRGFIGWYGQGPFTAEDTARRYPGDHGFHCPYGLPGDRLWVRETFASPVASWTDYGWEWDEDDGARLPGGKHRPGNQFSKRGVQYRASADVWDQDEVRWRPSIFMPRWASRLTLEVVNVRVERLQAITEEDARAEGITDGGCLNCGEPEPCKCAFPTPDARDSFIHLWDSINAERAPWSSNPWVWVIEFKQVPA